MVEQAVASFVDDVAPAGNRRLYAEAEKREPGFGEDDASNSQCGGNNDRGEGIGGEMTEDDSHVGQAERAGGKDELLLFERENLAAYNSGNPHPAGEREGDDDKVDGVAEGGNDDENEKECGKGDENINNAHHEGVHPASEIARANPYKGAEGDGNENYEKPDGEGYSGAVNHSGENVAAVLVGAENKSSRDPVLRSCKFFQRDGLVRIPWR